MIPRAAYELVLVQHRQVPMLHCDFWASVGRLAGVSPSHARTSAARAGWPTTCAEMGLLRRYRSTAPPKVPRPKVPHVKTVVAKLRQAVALLARHPVELAQVRGIIARLEGEP